MIYVLIAGIFLLAAGVGLFIWASILQDGLALAQGARGEGKDA